MEIKSKKRKNSKPWTLKVALRPSGVLRFFSVARRINISFQILLLRCHVLSIVSEVEWNLVGSRLAPYPCCAEKGIIVVSHLFHFFASSSSISQVLNGHQLHSPHFLLHLRCCQVLDGLSIFLAEPELPRPGHFADTHRLTGYEPNLTNSQRMLAPCVLCVLCVLCVCLLHATLTIPLFRMAESTKHASLNDTSQVQQRSRLSVPPGFGTWWWKSADKHHTARVFFSALSYTLHWHAWLCHLRNLGSSVLYLKFLAGQRFSDRKVIGHGGTNVPLKIPWCAFYVVQWH